MDLSFRFVRDFSIGGGSGIDESTEGCARISGGRLMEEFLNLFAAAEEQWWWPSLEEGGKNFNLKRKE